MNELLAYGITFVMIVAMTIMMAFAWKASTQIATLVLGALEQMRRTGQLEMRLESLSSLHTKADTLWVLAMRRGEVELVVKGLAARQEPLAPTEEALGWLAPFRDELQAWHREIGERLGDGEFMLALEQKMGARLSYRVDLPHGLVSGTALHIAAYVARHAEC